MNRKTEDRGESRDEAYEPSQIDQERIREFLGEGWRAVELINGWRFEFRRSSELRDADLSMDIRNNGRFDFGTPMHLDNPDFPHIPNVTINAVNTVYLIEKGPTDDSGGIIIEGGNDVRFIFEPEILSGSLQVGEDRQASVDIEYGQILGITS